LFTPVILATQEAEIRKIEIQNQPEQIVPKTLSQKNVPQKRAGKGATETFIFVLFPFGLHAKTILCNCTVDYDLES
jgi:hypothetical protein